MIDKSNLLVLFNELDHVLTKKGESRSVVIYGGAALIYLGMIDRATVDIDIFYPKLDAIFLDAIKEVGEKHLFSEYWINSTGSAFIKDLPVGWEKRATHLFEGKSLIVNCLDRVDLIFTKIVAELDRQEDMDDLKSLKPTQTELEQVKTPLLALENNPEWKEKVLELLEYLSGTADGH